MKPEVTNLLQTPRGMGSCDVIISWEHFEEGVPVLWRPHKRKRLWNVIQLKTDVYIRENFDKHFLFSWHAEATYFPPGCVTTLWSFSSVPARLSLTSTPAGPRRWPLLRTWTTNITLGWGIFDSVFNLFGCTLDHFFTRQFLPSKICSSPFYLDELFKSTRAMLWLTEEEILNKSHRSWDRKASKNKVDVFFFCTDVADSIYMEVNTGRLWWKFKNQERKTNQKHTIKHAIPLSR